MRLSATAQLLVEHFDGYMNLEADVIAKGLFGVSLKTALTLLEFKKLIQADNSVSLIELANLIDIHRNDQPGDKKMTAQEMLELGLMAEHGKSLLPLEVVAEQYLKMNYKSALARFNTGELENLGLKGFRLNTSQKAPVFVLVSDLAEFILSRHRVKIAA